MKIVFFGTPNYVVPLLNALHKRFMGQNNNSAVVAVVTASPKPVGRSQMVEYSPVDKWAHKHGVPIYYEVDKLIKDGIKADIGVLESYGNILNSRILNYFPHGIINAHPSLLPKYRGSTPTQATILMGEKETGGTVIKLDEKIDHGPIISQFKEEVLPDDTSETLRSRIFDRSVEVMLNLLEPFVQGKISLKKQNDDESSMTWRIKKEFSLVPPKFIKAATSGKTSKEKWVIPFIKDCKIEASPINIERFVRSTNPWPGAWTLVKISREKTAERHRLKILKTHIEAKTLVLDLVQLEGKNPVSWDQFKSGYPNFKLG